MTGDQSSYTTDPGPATDDVAWTLQLAGSRAGAAWPLILNGSAYVLESAHPLTLPGSVNQVHRISLATGEVNPLTGELPQDAFSWASDGEHAYIGGRDSIMVVRLADGVLVTQWEYPEVPIPNRGPNLCVTMVVVEERLYVFCMATGNPVPGADAANGNFGRPFRDALVLAENHTVAYPFAASFDTAEGVLRWSFFVDASSTAGQTVADPLLAQILSLSGYPQVTFPTGLSVFGDLVALSGMHVTGFRDPDYGDHEGHCFLYLVDESTGVLVERFSSLDEEYRSTVTPAPDDATSCGLPGEPRWDPERRVVFGKFQRAFAINLRDYTYAAFQPFGDGVEEIGSGAAYDGRRLLMTSYQRISQFDAALQQSATPFQIPEADQAAFTDHSPILTDTTLYAMAHHDENNAWHRRSILYALDPGSAEQELAVRWKMELPHDADSVYGFNHLPSVGDGMLVLAGMDGTVTALGTTANSPVARARFLDDVEVGKPFRVDLSGSKPGLEGAPTQFRAEWGDGTTTEWQAEPTLEHTYATAPPTASGYTARFQVRNEAGQTASSFVPLLGTTVGGDGNSSWPWMALAGALSIVLLLGLVVVTRRRVASIALLVKGHAADRFTVLRELGRGSFGVAQLARDNKLGRDVVLKQPYGTFRTSPADRERFLQEARLAARVLHPNVVTVFEVIPEEEPPIMVLEFVPGGSLEARFQKGDPVPTSQVRRLTIDLLQGLAAIHAAGIVHRDLKPANVLVDAEGHAKVSDFGVARASKGPSPDETMARGMFGPGTMAYMSPEQLRGEDATEASDQYAAAALAFRLFAGRHHAEGADWSAEAVRRRILDGKVRASTPGIPPAMRPILAKALAHEPADRFPDVKTFLAEVASASVGEEGPA